MTPQESQQLADIHNLLTASGSIPTAGALKQIEDQIGAVQAAVAAIPGIDPALKASIDQLTLRLNAVFK